MHGFHGRILIVDATAHTFAIKELPPDLPAWGLGGKGLASRLLLDMNPPGCDPLGPDNHIIFATGPATQSLAWGSCRYGVYSKSPLTDGYMESYAGGKTPEAMDAAGYDAVVIHGQSECPTALLIHPDGCEFEGVKSLWREETYRTEDKLNALARERFPQYAKRGAAVIGPAGEKLVNFAVIENDYWRSAGRGGLGAVLGSKKIKGLVFTGDRRRDLAEPDALKDWSKHFVKTNKDSPGVKAYKAQGTTLMVALMNTAGAFPTKYWSQGTCDHWEKLSGDTYHAQHDVSPQACSKCFMACGRRATITSGKHKGLIIEGPEYETIYAFGGLCMIEDIGDVAYLNDLCDRVGIDTISAGNLCAFTIEAVAQGKVAYSVSYGDTEGVAGLLLDISARRGVGDILARGITHAARAFGMEDQAIHVKGMEPAGYDPRALKGMGLTYAISDRGACHLRTTFYKPELSGMIDPDTVEGKAELLIDFEDRLIIFDTLVLCRFFRDLYPWEELIDLIRRLTGLDATVGSLRSMASAIRDTTRRFNLREGVGPERDTLPKRLLTEALPSGKKLNKDEFNSMLADYYRLRGWDENGIPREVA